MFCFIAKCILVFMFLGRGARAWTVAHKISPVYSSKLWPFQLSQWMMTPLPHTQSYLRSQVANIIRLHQPEFPKQTCKRTSTLWYFTKVVDNTPLVPHFSAHFMSTNIKCFGPRPSLQGHLYSKQTWKRKCPSEVKERFICCSKVQKHRSPTKITPRWCQHPAPLNPTNTDSSEALILDFSTCRTSRNKFLPLIIIKSKVLSIMD